MPEQEFTNREINQKFDSIKEVLFRIEAQTIKTNGRVTALEEKGSERRGAENVVRWILLFLMTTIFAYLGWLGVEVSNINKALSLYEIEIQ